ncbi:MAG: MFS transporter [Polyangiaceae bacterium]
MSLILRNRQFRCIWAGQVVSELGDWFQLIALLSVLPTGQGRSHMVAGYLALRMIPMVIFGPFVGQIADRFHRGRVMIVCDLLRALIVMSFIVLVRDTSSTSIVIIYVLSFIQESISAVFEPARGAAIPQVVEREHLLSANTIAGATWSAMVALGAALGGLATQHLGRDTAFVINALSFVLSAGLIAWARVPALGVTPRSTTDQNSNESGDTGHDNSNPNEANAHVITPSSSAIREVFRFLREHPAQLIVSTLKGSWGLMGGVLVLFSVYSDQVFSHDDPRAAAGCLGMLYAGRGLGALIGPYVAKWIFGESISSLSFSVLAAYPTLLIGYLCFALSGHVWLGALSLVVAHAGASTIWVSSTQLLQLSVPNRMLGRVIALELAFCTGALGAAMIGMGQLLDHTSISAQQAGIVVAMIPLATGTLWALLRTRVVNVLSSDPGFRTG